MDSLEAMDDQVSALRQEVEQTIRSAREHRGLWSRLRQLEAEVLAFRNAVAARLSAEAPAFVEARLWAVMHQAEAIQVRICEG